MERNFHKMIRDDEKEALENFELGEGLTEDLIHNDWPYTIVNNHQKK